MYQAWIFKKKIKIFEKNIFDEGSLELLNKKFEIIFIDPPYKEKKLNFLLKKIYQLKILEKNGLLIIHRHKKDKDKFTEEYKVIKEKVYGISKLIFLS